MGSKKSNNYIQEELDWLEQKAEAIKRDVDSTPYDRIKDRIVLLDGPRGPVATVVQKEEVIKEAYRKSLKDYSELISAINEKREIDEKKKEVARGGASIPHRMKK